MALENRSKRSARNGRRYVSTVNHFTQIKRNGKTALVDKQYADVVADALLDGEGCTPLDVGGRGTVLRFAYPGGRGIIRPYRRGGLIRHVMRDTYLLSNRPLHEFKIHLELLKKGLSLPPLLGVTWERRGLFVRGALATHALEAQTLLAWLGDTRAETKRVLHACGATIRKMHELHVWHADLQLGNILIENGTPYLIDFDNARILQNLSPLLRGRNLLRLKRSFEKNNVDLQHFQTLCAGYGIDALPTWLGKLYQAKGKVSDIASRRNRTHE